MRVLFEQAKGMQDEQEEFRMYLNTQAHRQSIRLCNLASLLTDFGPQHFNRPLKTLKEVAYTEFLSPELVKDNAIMIRKVRVLEQGEVPESDEDDLD